MSDTGCSGYDYNCPSACYYTNTTNHSEYPCESTTPMTKHPKITSHFQCRKNSEKSEAQKNSSHIIDMRPEISEVSILSDDSFIMYNNTELDMDLASFNGHWDTLPRNKKKLITCNSCTALKSNSKYKIWSWAACKRFICCSSKLDP